MIQTRPAFLCLAFLLLTHFSHADDFFDNLRDDQTIPKQCSATSLEYFSETPTVFTVGIENSKDEGFDDEVAITRSGARALWEHYLGMSKSGSFSRAVQREPRLREYYEQMISYDEEMGFNFKSEGDILEFLYLMKLKDGDKSDLRYYTSGIAYHKAQEQNLIGELDIVIGFRDTCQIVSVGEAKLGIGSLHHARSQLGRFRAFLRNSISSFFPAW